MKQIFLNKIYVEDVNMQFVQSYLFLLYVAQFIHRRIPIMESEIAIVQYRRWKRGCALDASCRCKCLSLTLVLHYFRLLEIIALFTFLPNVTSVPHEFQEINSQKQKRTKFVKINIEKSIEFIYSFFCYFISSFFSFLFFRYNVIH